MGSDKPGVQVELVAAPEAARQARALVDQVAAGMPGDVGFRARVAVGELVANSVEHAGTAFDRVGLSVSRSGTVIRGEVRDRGAPFDDAPRVVPGRATSGRGLRLVDALVDRWGVEHENGNLVWFEIDEPGEGDDDPRSTHPPDAEHDYARIEVFLVAGDDVVSLATFPVSALESSPQEQAASYRGPPAADSPEALFRALRPSDSGVRHLWAHQADLLRDYQARLANVTRSRSRARCAQARFPA